MRGTRQAAFGILLGMMFGTGCQHPGDGEDVDGPMFGRAKRGARFLISAEEPVGVGELVEVARLLGPYRQLEASEMEALEARLEKELGRLVEVEFETLLRAEKRASRGRVFRRPVVTRASAREVLLARLGRDLALPLLTSDNRSVVVFGRVTGEAVKVSATAYEVEGKLGGGGGRQEVGTPGGGRAVVVEPAP